MVSDMYIVEQYGKFNRGNIGCLPWDPLCQMYTLFFDKPPKTTKMEEVQLAVVKHIERAKDRQRWGNR